MDKQKVENGGTAPKGLALEMFGFTREELQDRVVDQLCSQVMSGKTFDEDGGEVDADSAFAKKLRESVEKQINDTIEAMAAKHVLPNVKAYIENLTLQETTKWGEKKGEPLTFIEYLVQRAEAYMQEQVDHKGNGKGRDSYSWNPYQSRITYLINENLSYAIHSAMEGAVKSVNDQISDGIAETVKMHLREIGAKLKPVAPKVTE